MSLTIAHTRTLASVGSSTEISRSIVSAAAYVCPRADVVATDALTPVDETTADATNLLGSTPSPSST
jgi:hypothetical protein